VVSDSGRSHGTTKSPSRSDLQLWCRWSGWCSLCTVCWVSTTGGCSLKHDTALMPTFIVARLPHVSIRYFTTARTVCGEGSMWRYGVRSSVCPSTGPLPPLPQSRRCRFTAVGSASRRFRSIAAAAAGECGECHVVSVRSSWTQTCQNSFGGSTRKTVDQIFCVAKLWGGNFSYIKWR